MSLANPWALSLLSLIPVIFYLHSLRMERRELRVSAVFLWEETLEEQRNRPIHRKLNLNLLLLLQVAAVAALSVGLARPQLLLTASPVRRAILIMDVSASMRAMEGEVERFAIARREAHDLVKRLTPDGEMMVLEAGAEAVVRSGFTNDKTVLHEIIDSVRATDEPGRIAAAVNLGRSLAEDGGMIYLITDGAGFSGLELESDGAVVRPIIVGSGGRNVGITGMALRRKIDGSGDYQLLIRTKNFTQKRMEAGLAVSLGGTTIHRRNLALRAASAVSVIIPLSTLWPGEIVASLDVEDDFPVDNVAYALLPSTPALRVLLISEGNFFLEEALAAYPGLKMTRISDVNAQSLAELMREQDVAVFDGIPAPDLPEGSYLIIGAPVAVPALRITGQDEGTYTLHGSSSNPLLNHLENIDVRVGKVLRAELPEGGELIAGSGEAPLIYSYSTAGLRLVYMGFRLRDSDLPLTPAFPVLLGNMIKWLRPGEGAESGQALTGSAYLADLGPGAREAIVKGPLGEKFAAPLEDGFLRFRNVRRAGFYDVRAGSERRRFAANLFDEEESDIGVKGAVRERERFAGLKKEKNEKAANPVWRYFLLSALGFVTIEGLLLSFRR